MSPKAAAIRTAKTATFQASTVLPSRTETGSMLKAAIIALIWSPARPIEPISDAGAARKSPRKTSASARLVAGPAAEISPFSRLLDPVAVDHGRAGGREDHAGQGREHDRDQEHLVVFPELGPVPEVHGRELVRELVEDKPDPDREQ